MNFFIILKKKTFQHFFKKNSWKFNYNKGGGKKNQEMGTNKCEEFQVFRAAN